MNELSQKINQKQEVVYLVAVMKISLIILKASGILINFRFNLIATAAQCFVHVPDRREDDKNGQVWVKHVWEMPRGWEVRNQGFELTKTHAIQRATLGECGTRPAVLNSGFGWPEAIPQQKQIFGYIGEDILIWNIKPLKIS